MKATIENPVSAINQNGCFVGEEIYTSMLSEFNLILSRICSAPNETKLRSSMTLDTFEHFLFGFGGSHMWVKQVIDGEPKQQVIFVQF